MITPPTLLCDFYKLSHREQYPKGTEVVYSTWTPRSNKYHRSADKVVVYGIQGFIKQYLINYFNEHFFSRPIEVVLAEYSRVVKYALGVSEPATDHIKLLHELGYLPIAIKAIPEGLSVPIKVPMMTIYNTDCRFPWVTNFLETLISAELWMPCTSATIAKEYKDLLLKYAEQTTGVVNHPFVPFQGHDFSMRGMSSVGAAAASGSGHLLSFVGTDTIPAIMYHEQYYNANIENELVGTSIPATEHSVMCAGGDGDGEFATYKRLITEVYPAGFVSIVSDTWDLWECLEHIIKPLKDEIMARDGKVVIRPDSGNPADIICGLMKPHSLVIDPRSPQSKGLIEILWDIFGGTVNAAGYRELDPHIGAIYGDSITLERCEDICKRLEAKGFASTNMVYGIGSYTYQYNTRDTFGFALKSTAVVIDGVQKNIYKNPATDDGTKKSNTGVVAVLKDSESGEYVCVDGLTFTHDLHDEMRTVFYNGILEVDDTLSAIRERITNGEGK